MGTRVLFGEPKVVVSTTSASYVDHCFPPGRGYGYVGASRARSREGLYLYGRVRRTDWLPVGGDSDEEDTMRGEESLSDEEAEIAEDIGSDEDSRFDVELRRGELQAEEDLRFEETAEISEDEGPFAIAADAAAASDDFAALFA